MQGDSPGTICSTDFMVVLASVQEPWSELKVFALAVRELVHRSTVYSTSVTRMRVTGTARSSGRDTVQRAPSRANCRRAFNGRRTAADSARVLARPHCHPYEAGQWGSQPRTTLVRAPSAGRHHRLHPTTVLRPAQRTRGCHDRPDGASLKNTSARSSTGYTCARGWATRGSQRIWISQTHGRPRG